MQRRNKIFLWTAAVSGALIAFALALPFLATRVIDLGSINGKIQTTLSREIGGSVDFERVDLALFPRPCVKARRLHIQLPGTAEGTIDTLSIYPRILPLFIGELHVAAITAVAPDFTVRIPDKSLLTMKAKEADTLAAVREAITAAGARLASQIPDLVLAIQDGRVAVSYAKDPPVSVEHLEVRIVFPPRGFSITVDCETPFWKNISIDATLDPQTLAAEGTLKVESLKPHLIGPYLFPDGTSPVGDSLVDLDLSFKTDSVKIFSAKGTGAAPSLRFLQNRQELLIERMQFKGSVEFSARRSVIAIDELKAASPRLALKGSMHLDEETPRAKLTITGSNIDIRALRHAVLFFTSQDPTVQGIFDVLRAGGVPAITFTSSGRTLSDLGDLKRMRIIATLQQGSIDIPGTPLHLTNVAGNADIAGGILRGDQLSARLGNTSAQNGTLRLGLQGGDAPLHLDLMLKADLAELPPLLKAFISDAVFTQELDLLRNVEGSASGRLVLGESTRSITVTADISSFELRAAYQRIPFPVELRGGRFFFDAKTLSVEHIGGEVGKSSFTELTARLGLTAPYDFEITSARFKLVLDELYPWLPTFAPVKKALMGIESVQGTALLSIQHAGLPLAKPETVRFSAAGSVKNLAIGSTYLPGRFIISQGSFSANTEAVSITNADAEILDASLNISGKLDGYLKTIRGGDMIVTGALGEKAVQWIAKKVNLPPEFNVRPPLSLSKLHLAWQGMDTVACSGTVGFRKGPSITLDVSRDPRKLMINALRIQDGDNRADISLKADKKVLDLAFSGALRERTLAMIFMNEQFHLGRLSGKFKAHVPLDKVRQSTAQGIFEGEHLLLPLAFKIPTMIDHISLKADGSRITVGSANVSFGDVHLYSSGTISASSSGFLIDADLSADKIAVDSIGTTTLGSEGNTEKQAQNKLPKGTWDLPLRGTVRFSAGAVRYGQLSAGPVRANIDLGSNSIRAAVSEASLCGISLPGTVTVTPADISLDLAPAAEQQDLASNLACLGSKSRLTGIFSVKGRFAARGTAKTLLRSIQGKVEVTAKDGLIYYDRVLVKVLSFLSVNELMRGKLPDPAREGVPFRSVVVKGTVREGVLHVAEYSIDGPVVDIAGQGDVDLDNKTLDLAVVVAPLTITTEIIKNIPGLNYILNGTLVTIPLHVYGPFDDVKVSYNPATAVGDGIFGILKRIIQIPLKPFESN